jgi:hypothetical protein
VLAPPFAYDLGVLSFFYQYLVGGLVFFLGLWLVFGSGELGTRGRRGGRLALLLIGLGALALLQGLLQWAARP